MSNNFLWVAFGTMPPTARINPKRFCLMEKCGCKLDFETREEILCLLNKYLSNRHMQIVWPKANTKMKNSLRRIARQSYTLAREISGDDVRDLISKIAKEKGPEAATKETKGFLEAHDAIQYMLAKNLGIELDRLDAEVITLFHISGAARRALLDMPSGKSGPVDDTEIVPFLRELHALFKKAKGKGIYTNDSTVLSKPFKGDFFRFVRIVLKALPNEYQRTNRALGKLFEKARLSAILDSE